MIKVILFSPTGYVGASIRQVLENNENILLYEISRESILENYTEQYDVLVYSASITAARKEKPEKYIIDNSLTASRMVHFCIVHHIKKIIYLSTDEIYGRLKTSKASKESIMVEPNIYASTKYLAEKIIRDSGISYFILRLPAIVGKQWGSTFLYQLMEKAKQNQDICIYNGDKEFNNVIEINDLVQFIVYLIMEEKYDQSEIFVLGNEQIVKLSRIVEYVKELHHSTSQIVSVENENARWFLLDVSEAIKCGYKSKPLFQILDELYDLQGERHNEN